MATANNISLITELDADLIYNNLQQFLKSQSLFTDYNFDGAGLSIFLRLLAYNTHLDAFMANMLGVEMFPVTAQIRDNIITGSKSIGYVPKSMSAPIAFVNITVTPNGSSPPSTLLLPQYTQFISTAINGTNYQFTTPVSYVTTIANGVYTFSNVELIEGIPLNYTFVADETNNSRNSFNIPNANVDTTTIIVNVIENTPSPSQTWPYILNTDITSLDGNSRVYFLEGSSSNTYNVYFGDGILGKKPSTGDVINVLCIATDGDVANYANSFAALYPIGGYGNVIVSSVTAASGGAPAETNDSIAKNAPLFYTSQNRAVTLTDFKSILLRNYPNISSISVWGGDQNDPPIYGQVFISIKPTVGDYLTNLQKNYIITNILNEQNMVTVKPNIVDADYTYIKINAVVNYNPKLTSLSSNQLISTIQNAILNYNSNYLGKFDSSFRRNILENMILYSEKSILGVDCSIRLQKRFYPTLNQSANYTLKYYTPIYRAGLFDGPSNTPTFSMFDNTGTLENCFIEENSDSYTNIGSISVVNPGSGYSYADVAINGDGTGAVAHAVIVNGTIQSVVVDNAGVGYTIASATITGDGYGSVINPIINALNGTLATYYILNSNKFFITNNQGTIDHNNGIIVLQNFSPVDVGNPQKMLAIDVTPTLSVIPPSRNNIMRIDPTDVNAITITLQPEVT